MSVYMLCLVLFFVGVYCILVKRNLIKIIIGISIMEYAVNLFLVLVGYRMRGRAPCPHRCFGNRGTRRSSRISYI